MSILSWNKPWASAKQAAGAGIAVGALILGSFLSSCTVADTRVETPATDLKASSPRPPAIRLSNRPVVTIDSLVPEQADDEVTISGAITQQATLLDGWLYQVQDETGSLWVRTNRAEPTVGELATVEGILRYESIMVGEIDASDLYLEEQSYRSEGS
ncbi:MAG: hypothetical protein WA783_07805 [Phormidesmis sp.]